MIPFSVIICGSREFSNYDLLKERCDFYLSQKLQDPMTEVVIISGAARGADTLGEKYAQERGLQVKQFPANWEKYGKSAGYKRNYEMASVSSACIAFMDAYSECKGTKNMIEIAKQQGLLVRIVEEEA